MGSISEGIVINRGGNMSDISNLVSKTDILLTASDIAKRMNVSQATAYLWMREGRIPTIRLNNMIRVREKDLEEFIQMRREAPKPQSMSLHR
jgi:excisionase family DNA binding protein